MEEEEIEILNRERYLNVLKFYEQEYDYFNRYMREMFVKYPGRNKFVYDRVAIKKIKCEDYNPIKAIEYIMKKIEKYGHIVKYKPPLTIFVSFNHRNKIEKKPKIMEVDESYLTKRMLD